MITIRSICFLALLVSALPTFAGEFTIMTYNIRNGIDIDGRHDLESVGRLINSVDADVVALQEVDSVTRRMNGRYILGELGNQTGMTAIYGPAIDYEGGKYGIGMLCRVAPDTIIRMSLPGREEARTAIIAVWPDRAVGCTHLSLTEEDRNEGAKMVARELSRLALSGRKIYLAGDFNADFNDPIFETLDKEFGLKRTYGFNPTYPSDRPTDMIDHILTNDTDSKVTRAEVIDCKASDHRPLVIRND